MTLTSAVLFLCLVALTSHALSMDESRDEYPEEFTRRGNSPLVYQNSLFQSNCQSRAISTCETGIFEVIYLVSFDHNILSFVFVSHVFPIFFLTKTSVSCFYMLYGLWQWHYWRSRILLRL